MTPKGTKKTCSKGHQFYKSSDCNTCPVCENERKPKDGFLENIAAPARRALERENILSVNDLTKYSEKEILALHGMGKSTIPKLRSLLLKAGLDFKSKSEL